MSTITSDLYLDIEDIISPHDSKYNSHFNIEVTLHTIESTIDHTNGIYMTNLVVIRDYIDNISDYIEVTVSIPMGIYIYNLYDNLDNIEIELSISKQLYKDEEIVVVTERYKAVYLLDKNEHIPNTIVGTESDMNQLSPVVVTFQLLDKAAEVIRVKTTSGCYASNVNPSNSDMSVKALLKSIISSEVDKIFIDGENPIEAIYIEEPSQSNEVMDFLLPSKTRVVEVPEILQNKSLGVYNGGIGSYIQKVATDYHEVKKTYFIYSAYNVDKYDTATNKAIIYVPPDATISTSDITYKYEDFILRLISLPTSAFSNTKESRVMSEGSGFETANALLYMRKPIEPEPDGPVYSSNSLNTEVSYKERNDGIQYTPNRGVIYNNLRNTSETLSKAGFYVTLEVMNIDQDLLTPGMAIKISYMDNSGEVSEILGVLHGVTLQYQMFTTNPVISINSNSSQYTTKASLQIYCLYKTDQS